MGGAQSGWEAPGSAAWDFKGGLQSPPRRASPPQHYPLVGTIPIQFRREDKGETLWLLSVGSWRVLNLSLSILLSHPELIPPHVCLVERIKGDT